MLNIYYIIFQQQIQYIASCYMGKANSISLVEQTNREEFRYFLWILYRIIGIVLLASFMYPDMVCQTSNKKLDVLKSC